MDRFLFLLSAVLLLAAPLRPAAAAEPGAPAPPTVVIADLEGVIGPAQADWVDQALDDTIERGAAALLLRL
ncbi:MAG TPA: nodulation protein NfeD, partial [Gammaproteobacteria bacterium]|nr:nodulation protein NfeD [Gammaproteobacteria bacterium]